MSNREIPADLDVEIESMPSATAAKTLSLLDRLSRFPHGASGSELARESGFSQNLVFRILKTLVGMGYAIQKEDKSYLLSNRILELSSPRREEKSLTECSHEAIRWLRDETGETVQLGIEAGKKLLVLEQLRGVHPLQVCGEVGMRVPMYSCAPGKALLANWSVQARSDYFRGKTLKQFTPNTVTKRSEIDSEFEIIRNTGYAVDRAEGNDGIHCVAAIVSGEPGHPFGAITIMAPASRMPEERFPEIAALCREAVSQIETKIRS